MLYTFKYLREAQNGSEAVIKTLKQATTWNQLIFYHENHGEAGSSFKTNVPEIKIL